MWVKGLHFLSVLCSSCRRVGNMCSAIPCVIDFQSTWRNFSKITQSPYCTMLACRQYLFSYTMYSTTIMNFIIELLWRCQHNMWSLNPLNKWNWIFILNFSNSHLHLMSVQNFYPWGVIVHKDQCRHDGYPPGGSITGTWWRSHWQLWLPHLSLLCKHALTLISFPIHMKWFYKDYVWLQLW